MHRFTVLLYSNQTRRTNVCLAVTCHMHFWQNDQNVYVRVGTDTEIGVGTESWPWRRTFSGCSCWDSNRRPFDHESVAQPLSRPRYVESRDLSPPPPHPPPSPPPITPTPPGTRRSYGGVLWPVITTTDKQPLVYSCVVAVERSLWLILCFCLLCINWQNI